MATEVGRQRTSGAARYDSFVAAQLAQAEWRIRLLDVGAALLAWLAGALVYLVVMVLLDSKLDLSEAARRTSLYCFAAASLVFCWVAILAPLRRRINPYYAARQVERLLPDAKNSVVNWIDLHAEKLSPVIHGALGQRAARDLGQIDLQQAISGRRTGWMGALAGIGAAGFLICFFLLGPIPFFSFLKRSLSPFSNTPPATRTRITVVSPEGGNAVLTVGRSFAVTTEVDGRVPDIQAEDALRLQYRYDESEPYLERPLARETGLEWRGSLSALEVRTGFWYRITGGDAATPVYRVEVRAAPTLTAFLATYHFRSYTARPDEVSRQRDLRGLRGTEVLLRARANRRLREARLEVFNKTHLQGTPAIISPESPESFEVKLVLEEEGQYRLSYTADNGETYLDPCFYSLSVVPDSVPRVELTVPRQDVTLPANGLLNLEGKASDDVGVKELTLRMQVDGGPQLQARPYRSPAALRLEGGGYPREVAYKDFLDLGQVKSEDGQPCELKNGTALEYWLEGRDACDHPQANVGESKHQRIHIGKAEPPSAQARRQRKQAEQDSRRHETQQDQRLRRESQARQQERQEQQERNQEEERKNREAEAQSQANRSQDGDQKDSQKQENGQGSKSEPGKGQQESASSEKTGQEGSSGKNDPGDRQNEENRNTEKQAGNGAREQGEQRPGAGQQQDSKPDEKSGTGKAEEAKDRNQGAGQDNSKGDQDTSKGGQEGKNPEGSGDRGGMSEKQKEMLKRLQQSLNKEKGQQGNDKNDPSSQQGDKRSQERSPGQDNNPSQVKDRQQGDRGTQEKNSQAGDPRSQSGENTAQPGKDPKGSQEPGGSKQEPGKASDTGKSPEGSSPESKPAGDKPSEDTGKPSKGTGDPDHPQAGNGRESSKKEPGSKPEKPAGGQPQTKPEKTPGEQGHRNDQGSKSQGGNEKHGGQPGEKSEGKPSPGQPEKTGQGDRTSTGSGEKKPAREGVEKRGEPKPGEHQGDNPSRSPERETGDSREKGPNRTGTPDRTELKPGKSGDKEGDSNAGQPGKEALDRLLKDLRSSDAQKRQQALDCLKKACKEARDPQVRDAAQKLLDRERELEKLMQQEKSSPEAGKPKGDREPGDRSPSRGKEGPEGKPEKEPGNGGDSQTGQTQAPGSRTGPGQQKPGGSEKTQPGKEQSSTTQPGKESSTGKQPGIRPNAEEPSGKEPGKEGATGRHDKEGNQPTSEGKTQQSGHGREAGRPGAGNNPGQGAAGPRGTEPEDPGSTPPRPGKAAPHRDLMMQLEKLDRDELRKVLKDANISPADWERFRAAYRRQMQREAGADREPLPAHQQGGGTLPSVAGKVSSDGKEQGSIHRALPPPQYRNPYRDFSRRLSDLEAEEK